MTTNKQLFAVIAELNKANRSEIHEHSHGGLTEVYWYLNDVEIAYGYFGDSSTVHVNLAMLEGATMTFQGERATALRHCGQCISVETDSNQGKLQA